MNFESFNWEEPDISQRSIVLATHKICYEFRQLPCRHDCFWSRSSFPLITVDNIWLYESVEFPSNDHKILVSLILKPYMPAWFKIKKNKYLTDGLLHIFEFIKFTSFLPENLGRMFDFVLERNLFLQNICFLGWFWMIRSFIIELGFRKIIKSRKLAFKTEAIKCFWHPKINF